MQCDSRDEYRTEYDGSTTTKETHPNLDTAADVLFFWRDTPKFNSSPRRGGGNHEGNTTFGGGQAFLHPCHVDAWMSRERTHVYIEVPKEFGLDPSQSVLATQDMLARDT